MHAKTEYSKTNCKNENSSRPSSTNEGNNEVPQQSLIPRQIAGITVLNSWRVFVV